LPEPSFFPHTEGKGDPPSFERSDGTGRGEENGGTPPMGGKKKEGSDSVDGVLGGGVQNHPQSPAV
ncbi:MAG: hypothetical protein QW084_06135, partial [Candidatus Hadarchaeales archaeon]